MASNSISMWIYLFYFFATVALSTLAEVDKSHPEHVAVGTTLIPMFQGFGSHYVFLDVGTPPKRQSVIVDTTNHFTAFPCASCKDCGKHVDPLWNPKSSSTANVPESCPVSRPGAHTIDNKCVVGQSYKDGSSWEGFLVKDIVHLGGLSSKDTVSETGYDFMFTFICETQETDIFKNQLANGVLGLSRAIDTLPMMMRVKGVTTSASFALCYRIGGGIMTVGGIDNRLNKNAVKWLKISDLIPTYVPGNNVVKPPADGSSSPADPAAPAAPVVPNKHEDFDDDDDDDSKDKKKSNNKHDNDDDDDDDHKRMKRRLQPADIFDEPLPSMNGGSSSDVAKKPTPFPGQISTRDLNRLSAYVVVLSKITIMSPTSRFSRYDSDVISFEYNSTLLNKDRGCIIDSGSTDITVPNEMFGTMSAAFAKIAGVTLLPNGEFTLLDPRKLNALPTFRFSFVSADNANELVHIDVPFSTYVDQLDQPNQYAVRIRPQNANGVNLGAKFLLGRNVMFDVENRKIGVADSDCKYEDFVTIADGDDDDDIVKNENDDKESNGNNQGGASNGCRMKPVKACSAVCDRDEDIGYTATGIQEFENECDSSIVEKRDCTESCNGQMIVRGNPQCPDSPWKECSADGIQKRHTVDSVARKGKKDAADDDSNGKYKDSKCSYNTEVRTCYTDHVPVREGDYLIFIDMKFPILPQDWSYVHAEVFFETFNQLFKLKESSMTLLNDITKEYFEVAKVKLHFQLRMEAVDYHNDMSAMTEIAQRIAEKVWEPSFRTKFINALEFVSRKRDKLDHSRYGFILPEEVEILNAFALPMGTIRESEEATDDDSTYIMLFNQAKNMSHLDLILVGIAIAAIILACCMSVLYFHLRQSQFNMSKDKPATVPLRKVWKVLQDANDAISGNPSPANNKKGYRAGRDYHVGDEAGLPLTGVDSDDVHL